MWWSGAQYFVIASCGLMPRDAQLMYVYGACLFLCLLSNCVGSVGMFVV